MGIILRSGHWLSGVPWLSGIEAISALAMAVIAFLALQTWRRQDKAKKEAEFLDALVEAAHTYIAEMQAPLAVANVTKIGLESYASSQTIPLDGAVLWIQRYGEAHSKRMTDALESVRPSLARLRSLASKGQVFKFFEYEKCQRAIELLTWQHDRLTGFWVIIGSTGWNWENPDLAKHLENLLNFDVEEVRKEIGSNDVAIILFSREIYRRLYG